MGSTTRQMLAAPKGAVFIWGTAFLHYPKALAKQLGREDLEIVPLSWLDERRYQGRELTGIVVDHAIHLTWQQCRLLDDAEWKIKRHPGRSA